MAQWRVFVQPPRQGTSHKKENNAPCQDKVEVVENEDVIVAVLSDGLGSLEYSAIAASAVVKGTVTYLLENYNRAASPTFKYDVLNFCVNSIEKVADQINHSVNKMDCTLLFVIVYKKIHEFVYGQLGDGAICAVHSNSAIKLASQSNQTVNFAASSNMTKTVRSSDAIDYFKIETRPLNGCVGFILASDGLENEIYSKAGKAKNNIEWYYNLVSQNEDTVCLQKIENRLSELTADEAYGFTDDISLIVIAQSDVEVELPNDANWLCVCGHRNKLESTRCEECDKDFTKLYKGVNFKAHGGKAKVFTSLNDNPDEEEQFLRKHCTYTTKQQKIVESTINDANDNYIYENNQVNIQQPASIASTDERVVIHKEPCVATVKQEVDRLVAKNNEQTIRNNESKEDNERNGCSTGQSVSQKGKNTKKQNSHYDEKSTHKSGNIINILICFMIICATSLLSFYGGRQFENNKYSKSTSDTLSYARQINVLEDDNKRLSSENDFLSAQISVLYSQLSESQKDKLNLPLNYASLNMSNGDVYIGKMLNDTPNGRGVLFLFDSIMVGDFIEGKKQGTFFVFYNDGKQEELIYINDKLIGDTSPETTPTNTPTNEATNNENGETTTETVPTEPPKKYSYEIIVDVVNIRSEAKIQAAIIAKLNAGDVVQSDGKTETDLSGKEWIKIITNDNFEGWIVKSATKKVD